MSKDTENPNPIQQRWTIVVIDFNGLADTQKCLASLSELHGGPPRVIVVDNGSNPPTGPAINDAASWVEVIRSEVNGGWAGGNNVGISRALDRPTDFILLLNNDTTVDPRLLERLTLAADRHPNFGVFSPIVCYMDEPEKVNADGCRLFTAEAGFFSRHEIPCQRQEPPGMEQTELVNGCCFAVRSSLFEEIGTIDERFFLIHEESEFCVRARKAGYRCGVVPEKLVLHKGSSTFQRESKPWQRYFDSRNLYMLLRQHRSEPLKMPLVSTWLSYLKHVYYMYSLQKERNNPAAAEAVLAGFVDAIAGRYGPWKEQPRPLAKWIQILFEWRRRFSSSSSQPRSP